MSAGGKSIAGVQGEIQAVTAVERVAKSQVDALRFTYAVAAFLSLALLAFVWGIYEEAFESTNYGREIRPVESMVAYHLAGNRPACTLIGVAVLVLCCTLGYRVIGAAKRLASQITLEMPEEVIAALVSDIGRQSASLETKAEGYEAPHGWSAKLTEWLIAEQIKGNMISAPDNLAPASLAVVQEKEAKKRIDAAYKEYLSKLEFKPRTGWLEYSVLALPFIAVIPLITFFDAVSKGELITGYICFGIVALIFVALGRSLLNPKKQSAIYLDMSWCFITVWFWFVASMGGFQDGTWFTYFVLYLSVVACLAIYPRFLSIPLAAHLYAKHSFTRKVIAALKTQTTSGN